MPDIVQWLRLKGDSSGLEKAADKAGSSLVKNFAVANIAAQAITKAMGVLKDAIGSSIEAAQEYERTTIALSTALKTQGREVENNLKGMEAQASVLEGLSGISDEVIRKYQAQATNLGKTTRETDELIRASLALSHVTGRDLRTSFEALLKLETGLIDRSVKLLPEIANLTKEQLKAGEATDIINEKFGNLVGLGTQGSAGSLVTLKNEFANLGEVLVLLTNEEDGPLKKLTLRTAELFEFYRRAAADNVIGDLWDRLAFIINSDKEDAREYLKIMRDVEKTQARIANQADETANRGRLPTLDLVAIPQAKKGSSKGDDTGFVDELWKQDEARIKAEQDANEARLQNERDFQDLKYDITRDADDRLAEWRLHQNEYQLDMDRQYQRDELAIQRESFDITAATMEGFEGAASSAFGSALGSLVAFAEGAKVSAADMAIGVLKGVGKELVGLGGTYILKGIARAFEHRGMDPTAYGMMAVGASMITMGTGLIAGGTVMSGGGGSGGGGSMGAGSSGSGAGAVNAGDSGQLATRDSSQDTETRRGPETITIVFQGPTSPEGIGVAVNGALASAKAKGLI